VIRRDLFWGFVVTIFGGSIFPGGTVEDGDGGGGGEPQADAVLFEIEGATAVDPSDILASVAQDPDDGTITIVLDDDTISNTPALAAKWTQTLTDIYGNVSDYDLQNVFRALMKVAELAPPSADLWLGVALESDDDRGIAWRLASVSGDWQVQHAARATGGGAWSAWTAATSNASTQTLDCNPTMGTATNQLRHTGYARDTSGTPLGGTSTTAMSQVAGVGGDFTKISLCAGWVTGTGATVPATVNLQLGHFLAKLTEVPLFASFFQ